MDCKTVDNYLKIIRMDAKRARHELGAGNTGKEFEDLLRNIETTVRLIRAEAYHGTAYYIPHHPIPPGKRVIEAQRAEIERLREAIRAIYPRTAAAVEDERQACEDIARKGMLVPPDGGSPNQNEIDTANRIADAIAARKS